MARTVAMLPEGIRITDHIRLGVIAQDIYGEQDPRGSCSDSTRGRQTKEFLRDAHADIPAVVGLPWRFKHWTPLIVDAMQQDGTEQAVVDVADVE